MRLLHVDGLRGLAIILVLLYHSFARWPEQMSFGHSYSDNFIISNGWLGVELFFMISGFVIFLSLERCSGFFNFIKLRYSRLLPSMTVAIGFIFLYSFFISELRPTGEPGLLASVSALLMVSERNFEYFNIVVTPLEGSFWTLHVEMKFYIFISLVYFSFGRVAAVYSSFVLSLLFSFLIIAIGYFDIFHKVRSFIYFLSGQYLCWFVVGILASCVYIKNELKFNKLLIFSVVVFPFVLVDKGFEVILFSYLMIIVFLLPFVSSKFSKFMSNKAFVFIGFLSYPIYLVHENFIVSFSRMLYLEFFLDSHIGILLSIFVVFCFSYITAKYLEPVIMRNVKSALNVT